MKAIWFILTVMFISNAAFADISIDCVRRRNKTGVFLVDVRNGFSLKDTGNPLIGERNPIKPQKLTANSMIFKLDDGTSIKQVYTYNGLSLCEREGNSNLVKLQISRLSPSGSSMLAETINCTCDSD